MAVRCAEASTGSWPGGFAKNDPDQPIRGIDRDDVPFAGEGSDRLIEIRLAMPRLRASLSTAPKNDPTNAPPLRILSRPATRTCIADSTDGESSHTLPGSCLRLISPISRNDWGQ